MPLPSNDVFEYQLSEFSLRAYDRAVENLISRFERENDRKLLPKDKKKVGLKVYSASGAGLSTPENLVEAVIQALARRGFERTDVFITDLHSKRMRESGFLPPLSHRSEYFNEVFVSPLDTGSYYHELWYYDSPVALPEVNIWTSSGSSKPFWEKGADDSDRKSFLPMPLMHEVDFWINLPCYSDHPTLGVNGCLMNATIWNASNTRRFLMNQTNAPVAVAEIGAIPELREKWALNIVSLERFQFVGGPVFNSMYTESEPLVLLSDNPVMLDAIMQEKINFYRRANGFAPLPEELKILAFSEQLGLGDRDVARMDLINAN
ncbi:MAG: DUF362 domain-containing protein [Verrucomicrobiota bacterium]